MQRKRQFMSRHVGKFAARLLETFWPAPNGYCSPFGKSPDNIGDLLGNTYKIVEIFCENTQIIVGLGPVEPHFLPCLHVFSFGE
jgi:hypothetical protein